MLLRFDLLASFLLVGVTASSGREDYINAKEYNLAFNGHIDEYVYAQLDVSYNTTLEQWFPDRYLSGAIGVWIKPGQDLTGWNIIMEFTIKNHYVLFIENNSLMLAETGGDGTEAEGGNWSIYSYNLDLTSPDWIYVMVVVQPRQLEEEPHDPRVFAKGLDKSFAPQKLEYRVIGRKQMMEGYEKTDHLVIGRGFRGSLALLTVYRWKFEDITTDLFGQVLFYCMQKREPSKCIIAFYDQYQDDVMGFTYQISGPGSSIRWERNTIRPFFHSNIQCEDFGVNIDIDPKGFRSYFDLATTTQHLYSDYNRDYYKLPVNLTLGDVVMGCNFTWDGHDGMYTIRNSQLLDCGFTSTSLGNETLYQNTVYHHTSSASKKLMSISCRYEPRPVMREEITIPAYVFEEIRFTVDHTYAPMKMSLELFSDRFYTRKLQNPAMLADVDELIYVEARVLYEAKEYRNFDEDFELEVESCRTHVTLNEHDTLQTKLIDNFQPTNPSVTFIHPESSMTARKRFSFKAAQFKEYPNAVVYVSCILSAEDVTDPEKHTTEPEKHTTEMGDESSPDDVGEEEQNGEKRTPVPQPHDETETQTTYTSASAYTSTYTVTSKTPGF